MRDFKNIKTWQLADDLAVAVYGKTKSFPREEVYSLSAQLRRAAVSIPTNISEGAYREHKREYLHFIFIARGSLGETRYLIHLANRLGYPSKDNYEELVLLGEETSKTLHGLISSVKKETHFVSQIVALITSALAIYGIKMFGFKSVV
jgi:four helix bundle protein